MQVSDMICGGNVEQHFAYLGETEMKMGVITCSIKQNSLANNF